MRVVFGRVSPVFSDGRGRRRRSLSRRNLESRSPTPPSSQHDSAGMPPSSGVVGGDRSAAPSPRTGPSGRLRISRTSVCRAHSATSAYRLTSAAYPSSTLRRATRATPPALIARPDAYRRRSRGMHPLPPCGLSASALALINRCGMREAVGSTHTLSNGSAPLRLCSSLQARDTPPI